MSGSAKHYILEIAAKKNPARYVAEERLYAEVHGQKLGGQIDLYDRDTRTLYDYKESRVYKITKGNFDEWEAQANINRWLCSQNGIQVDEIRYIAFLKDWSDRDTGREGYPQAPVMVIPLPIWPEEKVVEYIERRVRLHMNFQNLPDNDIPVCTKEERWEGEGYFIVKHPENARATKKFPNEEFPELKEAKMRADQLAFELNNKKGAKKTGYLVEQVSAEPTRCLRFCTANKFCSFYADYIKNHQKED